MSEIRGVFSLSDAVDKKFSEEWTDISEVVFSTPSPEVFRYFPDNSLIDHTGYFGGGGPSITTKMDKLTYSNDTTTYTPSANLTAARHRHAATGNSAAGYFGGGSPGPLSSFEKLTYSTDTTDTAPGTNLSLARRWLAATGNSIAGYFGGGDPGPVTTMDKLTYSNDTTTYTPTANLTTTAGWTIGRDGLAATGNSTAGYFGGGYYPSPSGNSRMDKLTYSNDTNTYTPTANLSQIRYGHAATGNSTHGYFGGGISSGNLDTVEKLTYSTDTIANLPGSGYLSSSRRNLVATGNLSAGYFGGGTPYPQKMDKLTYSTDTTTYTPGADFSIDRTECAAVSSKANALPQLISTPTASTSFHNSPNTGYFGGGYVYPGSPSYSSVMDKVHYSTDTNSLASSLSQARSSLAATGSLIAGYFGGGSPSTTGIVEKVIYSSDTTALTPTADLVFITSHTATGNSTHGYFGGGYPSYSTMYKLTYSTETSDSLPATANLSAGRQDPAATSNSTAGYFGGGYVSFPVSYYSRMDKLTYSNDTITYTPGANLSEARYNHAATGNSTAGYFGGGRKSGSPSSVSRMDKLTYSNDTTAYLPGADLPSVRYGHGATGNQTAGYFGGGYIYLRSGLVSKLTYSTDTNSFSSNLSQARDNLAAVSSKENSAISGLFPNNV